jgi:hypothetical protein
MYKNIVKYYKKKIVIEKIKTIIYKFNRKIILKK